MKVIIIAALVMLMATPVLAFFDSTPNTIGIYLDPDAEEMCVPGLTDGMTEFTFYMIITNPTFATMDGFMAGYHFDGNAEVTNAVFAHANANDGGFLGEHMVHYDTPIPTSDSTLLMTLTATYYEFEYGSAVLFLHNLPLVKTLYSPTVFLDGGGTIDMHLSYTDGETIRINAACGSVASEQRTFDAVKSMFR